MSENRIDIICRNLQVVGDVVEGDKLITNGDLIEIDKSSYIQFATRWWTSQKAVYNLPIVKMNLLEAEDYIINLLKTETLPQPPTLSNKEGDVVSSANRFKNTQTIMRIRSAIASALKGLRQLELTYKDSSKSKSEIINLINRGQNTLQTIDYLLTTIPTIKINH